MDKAIQQLTQINWQSFLITLAIVITAYIAIKKGLEELSKLTGWEMPWMRNDRVHRELSQAVIAIKDELVSLKNDVSDIKTEVDTYNDNRCHDRDDSRNIRAEMYHDLDATASALRQELIDSVRTLGEKIDVLQHKIEDNELQKQIEKYRDKIFNFASNLNSPHFNPEKDHYDNIFKVYHDYENLLHENNLTNGQCESSMNVIRKHYEQDLDKGLLHEVVEN